MWLLNAHRFADRQPPAGQTKKEKEMMSINSRKTKGRLGRAGTLVAALAVLSLGACASMPEPPLQELQAAELAITSAEQAGVADYAAPQLNQAREKLASARTAVEQENMVLAARLADESKVEADLASANAEMSKAKVVNDEMQASIDTLKQEMSRNSGARQ
jgi:hypothetical protein